MEVELWSHLLEGGAEEEISLPTDVRLTNVAFGEELPDANGRSVIKLAYEDILAGDDSEDEEEKEEKNDKEDEDGGDIAVTVLTALTAGRVEQTTVNVVLRGERPYVLINTGKNPVYLTGNYIEHPDEPPYDSENEDLDSDEEGYDLREVSSDVEMDPLELEGLEDDDTDGERFEEIVEEPAPKAGKRPRDSDNAEEAPKEKKDKKNKKLKAEDGKAVPAGGEAAPEKKKEEKKQKKEDKKEKSHAVKILAGGLKIREAKVGDGPEAKKGSKVFVRYIGKLENGKVFDKNVKGKPFAFKLGKGEVIKGWDEGIVGMRVGSEREIIIPPALGYGKKGAGPDIPPNATLKFEVKLLQVA